ncbi:resolvase [Streptomyces sp. NBC_01716]|uniref:resolvase n=1 Tax=Streptomyces sp. NBC_01716 TaxID=2975917 RepID=UPI002E378F84|nr:resolvase [Streptomyces sp. NBC_01716]
MVQTLAAAGELQRDLQRELTYDGLRAAEAKGSKGGRRPAVPAEKVGDVRTAYLEGRSIAALARDHGVSRGAIRTAVADLLPDHTATEEAAAPELPVTLDMPGKVALPAHHRAGARRAGRARPGGDRTTRPGLHPARQRHPRRAPPAPRPLPAARLRPGHPCGPGPAQGPPRV